MTVNEPLDERAAKAAFYLRHRDDIEEWAALRSEARAYLELALLGLDTAVAALADELRCEAFVSVDDAIMTIYRAEWRTRTADVSIGLGWDRRRLLNPGYTEWAWVGVYLEGSGSPRGRDYAAAIKPLKQPLGFSSGSPWFLWRPVAPPPGRPIEPDDYAAQVLTEVRKAWKDVSPTISRV